jgi:hypothetical protein
MQPHGGCAVDPEEVFRVEPRFERTQRSTHQVRLLPHVDLGVHAITAPKNVQQATMRTMAPGRTRCTGRVVDADPVPITSLLGRGDVTATCAHLGGVAGAVSLEGGTIPFSRIYVTRFP